MEKNYFYSRRIDAYSFGYSQFSEEIKWTIKMYANYVGFDHDILDKDRTYIRIYAKSSLIYICLFKANEDFTIREYLTSVYDGNGDVWEKFLKQNGIKLKVTRKQFEANKDKYLKYEPPVLKI